MGRQAVKITADTNILIRLLTEDHPGQSRIAQEEVLRSEIVALTLPTLCEVAWVLSSRYRLPAADIAAALRGLIAAANVSTDHQAVEAGLAVLDAGGDFADGVIAYEGSALGADSFVSFDRKAVRLLMEQGRSARLLA